MKINLTILLFFTANLAIAFAQNREQVKDCPCTNSSAIATWKPTLTKSFDTISSANNFSNSVNGMYLAEDRDSLYQIKIIVDTKPYGRFVHFQHLSFSKKTTSLKKVTDCGKVTKVNDGGWIGRNVFTPSAPISKTFVASQFFVGDGSFRLNKSQFYRLYKCEQKNEFGIEDSRLQRFYRKVDWQPKGDFIEISLVTFTQREVKKYNKQQLAIMRNAVYARYNYAFAEGGKWYNYFNGKPNYRWNRFKDVTPFLTSVEKENLVYISAFEKPEYYDNQFANDFLTFWEKLRANVKQNALEKISEQVLFPFIIGGDLEQMPQIKITRAQFAKIWPLLLQQENYELNKAGQPTSFLTKNIFNSEGAFTATMLRTDHNGIANLNFEKQSGKWKLTGAYASGDSYDKITATLKNKN